MVLFEKKAPRYAAGLRTGIDPGTITRYQEATAEILFSMMTELGLRLADTVEIRLIRTTALTTFEVGNFCESYPPCNVHRIRVSISQEQTDQGTLLGGNPPTGFTPRYRRVPQSLRPPSEALASPPLATCVSDAWPQFSWYIRPASLEGSMLSHKFHVRQLVQLNLSIGRNVPGGSYEITKKLPEREGEFEYRIKSMNEPHERVARESEFRAV